MERQKDVNAKGSPAVESPSPIPSISLPKGGGAISGIGEKFSANPVTGTGSLTVPIAVSPGRQGFGPQLTLTYDSGGGNGPFGLGWTLSLPSITRRTDKGLPLYGDAAESDVFILSGAEDLVPALTQDAQGKWVRDSFPQDGYVVTRYRPRIEGLFARIERWTRSSDGDTYWRSISKDNVPTFYGKTPKSRIADPHDPRRVFTWLICESFDDKGNAIVYEYAAEDSANVDRSQANERNRTDVSRSANRYLKRIKYGNAPSRLVQPDLAQLSWLFEVVFDYGEGHYAAQPPDGQGREFVMASPIPTRPWPVRQDPFSRYRARFEERTYRLCRRVLMFHHFPDELGVPDYLVRATEFMYRENTVASYMVGMTQSGFVLQDDKKTYLKRSLPTLEFEYSPVQVQQVVHEVDPESLANLPSSVNGSRFQWLDLDGEGLKCVLVQQDGGWYYKRNVSPLTFDYTDGQPTLSARFDPLTEVTRLPAFAEATAPRHQFLDLAGDGQLDCVVLERPLAGFYKRTEEEDWDAFRPLLSEPNVDWSDPNLRFVDVDGDGHADILIIEDEVLTWYRSLAEEGFAAPIRVAKAKDEEEGPAIVFADGTQSIFLADMSGDGLSDIVRIRNGEVCYWPNLGYGQFGRKVTMDRAPWFDAPDLFDPRRIRLADIDGCGTTDLIYFASNGVRLYFNQSGNALNAPETLAAFPPINNISTVQALDLLGNGTACLVWTSPLPGDVRHSMRYVDLMGGEKPHLLIRSQNNLGAETRMFYAPSTKFYLADRAAGQPWVTRLPFPVHVVERVETYDWVSRNRFVTRYAYHHGFYDGVEREFRGFGRVDQFDTEELGALSTNGVFPNGTNFDAASYVSTVLTKTWFHTGAYFEEARISRHFEDEYWRESDLRESIAGLTVAEFEAMLLLDTVLPSGLAGDEVREAHRSLKGAQLRQEVYAQDGTEEADRPYTVSQRNYTIKRLQPFGPNRHAVFFTHARESIDFDYERKLFKVLGNNIVDPATAPSTAKNAADPRVTHAMTLEVDGFGNVLRSAAIGYRRRDLPGVDAPEQKQTHLTLTVNRFANRADEQDWYRVGLPVETRTYEIVKPPEPTITDTRIDLFRLEEISGLTSGLFPLAQPDPPAAKLWPYEKWDWHRNAANAPAETRLRLIEHVRTVYRRDDLAGPLALGQIDSLALPFESYKLAFTPGLLTGVYGAKLTDSMLANDGRYVRSEGDANWWIPSGLVFYSPNTADTPPQELAYARTHFFLPDRYRDPFHANQFNIETVLTFDVHNHLIIETRDARGNSVRAQNDYRVLHPKRIIDPNGNRSEVAFDALGMVVGTAVMGKVGENVGDLLTNFSPDLTQKQINDFFDANDPHPPASGLLRNATARMVYDLHRFRQSHEANPTDRTKWKPVFAATLARETHVSDPFPPGGLKTQISFSYSDGFGREIQKKIQAEPGPVVEGGPIVSPRWVGSGWTIFNNKGKPVRQYEPFFDDTHDFKFGVAVGVSPVLFYDPVARVVATLHPNHTYEKVVFDPWQQKTYDVNDTVTRNPKTDEDVSSFFTRLPDADYLPTWFEARKNGQKGPEEKSAADKAAKHADTPTVAYFDSLGRAFLTIAHNKFERNNTIVEETYATRVELDIEGNQREVRDARNRAVMRYDYDMLGTRIHQASMEAGERWMLNDVGGKPTYAWDSRNHQFHTTYDPLRRPTETSLREGTGPERLIGRTVYGESRPNPEVKNQRGKVVQLFDQVGVVTSDEYDFKGNLLASQRQLAKAYRATLDWSATVPLESEVYTSSSRFDALNRPISVTAPDNSVYRPTFNEANLLEKVDVNLRGAQAATPFVSNIDHDAKGQRVLIDYGNHVKTEYAYDPLTFRLIDLKTTRLTNQERLQGLNYTYDSAGNITQIRDSAQQTIYFNNQVVTPNNDYTYDAVYRLISVEGREHIGQVSQSQTTWDDQFRVHLPHPGDGQAMRRYSEEYEYDAVGNFLQLIHQATNGNWRRGYAYNEPSLIEAGKNSNRLSSTIVGANSPDLYTHDAHGNMTSMRHLTVMRWDFKDQLNATSRQAVSDGTPETTYYVYDAAGQRARKVTERQNGTRKNERIYLGGFEVYREYDGNGTSVTLERETLHVMDDKQRIALIETKTLDIDLPLTPHSSLVRYEFSNHLGSASLELDDAGQIISYEEYYPYGSTSYQAVRSQAETPKRYRYTGMERDEESGLEYHTARYYAPWLGRWMSADSAGLVDGANLYGFSRNNPTVFSDPSGRQADEPILYGYNRDLYGTEAFYWQYPSGGRAVQTQNPFTVSLGETFYFSPGSKSPTFILDPNTNEWLPNEVIEINVKPEELQTKYSESQTLVYRRAQFRARHEGHGEKVLDNIEAALNKVTFNNPTLLVAYYSYYAHHKLTDETPEKNALGDTEWGDTKINPLVLALEERKKDIKDTDNPVSLLGGTLLHEYVHTPQGGGHNAVEKWPFEAKAYGIESFFAGRMGDKTREDFATQKGSDYDRKIFNESERTIRALYEVIDKGNRKDAEQARQLSVEFISRTDKDYSPELKAFRSKLFR